MEAFSTPGFPGADGEVLPPAPSEQPMLPMHMIAEDCMLVHGAESNCCNSDPPALKSPGHSILNRLPTPVRSPKSTEYLDGSPVQHAQFQSGMGENRFCLSPTASMQQGARGQEPWGAGENFAAPQTQKGGYREWLQARGQQAMQRTFGPGQNASARPPMPIAAGQQGATGIMEALTAPSSQVTSWGSPNDMPMQQCYGTSALDLSPMMYDSSSPHLSYQQGSVTPVNCQQTQQLTFFPGSTTPVNSQQAPISFFGCQQGPPTPPMTPMAAMGFNACQQPPLPSVNSQANFSTCPQEPPALVNDDQIIKTCSSNSLSQEDLIATVMPEAFALDREQIAQQLRAAADSCVYED